MPPKERSEGWIGKLLAVAGVAVTLIGVVLLLVLAAQAGILRPEFRVAAGAVLAVALVGTAGGSTRDRVDGSARSRWLPRVSPQPIWMSSPSPRSTTGCSAPVGLILAAAIAGGGLTLARRWDSEHLGLLVMVPLIGLGAGRDRRHHAAARRLHAGVVGGVGAGATRQGLDLVARCAHRGRGLAVAGGARCALFRFPRGLWLAGACGIAALVAIGSALILLPGTANRVAMALLTGAAG